MTIQNLLAVVVCGSLTAACAYHNPTAPTRDTTPAALTPASIQLTAATRSDRALDVTATVLSADGRHVPGVDVAFSVNAGGAVSPTRATTDDSGNARTVLTTTSAQTSISAAAGALASSVAVVGTGSVPSPTPTPAPQPAPIPNPLPPTAPLAFTITGDPWPGHTLFFTLSSSTAARSDWTFGDGSPVVTTGAANGFMTHVYAGTGFYPVSVVVTDTQGHVSTLSGTAGILTSPPEIPQVALTCVVGNKTNVPTACSVIVTVGGVDVTAQVATDAVHWEFGDLLGNRSFHDRATSTTHQYEAAGSFNVSAQPMFNGIRGAAVKTVVIP